MTVLVGLCYYRKKLCHPQLCRRKAPDSPEKSEDAGSPEKSEDTTASGTEARLQQIDLDSDDGKSSSNDSRTTFADHDGEELCLWVDVDYAWFEPADGVGEVNLRVRPLRASLGTPVSVIRPAYIFAKEFSRDSQVLDEVQEDSDGERRPKLDRDCSEVRRDGMLIGACSLHATSGWERPGRSWTLHSREDDISKDVELVHL